MDTIASNDKGKRPVDPKMDREGCREMRFIENNLVGLRQFRDSLSSEAKKSFQERFGRIENIMDVEVDTDAIRAWVRHFNPDTGVFTFPNLDLTPTLDEYYYLVRSTWDKEATQLYTPDISKCWKKTTVLNGDLHARFGLKPSWFCDNGALMKGEGVVHIDWQKIFREMEKDEGKLKKKDPEKLANFLALGIFGLVLFPTCKDKVDSRVMEAVIHVIKSSGAKLMGMVLAETIRTCASVKRYKRSQFRCCTQLLTLWIHAHFPIEGGGKCKPWFTKEEDLIQQLLKQEQRKMNELQWLDKLDRIKESEITWQVSWLEDRKLFVIPPSGEYWLSLFGVFGAIRYSPGMVLRQFGGKQGIPAFSNKEQWDVEFKLGGRNLDRLDEMKAVWQGYERRTVIQGKCNNDYKGWRKNWILDQKMPKRPPPSLYLKLQESEERRQEEGRQKIKAQAETEKIKKLLTGVTGERLRHATTRKERDELKIEVAAKDVQIRRGEGKLEAAWDDRKKDLREKKGLLREVQELEIQYEDSLKMNKRLRNDKAKVEVERDFYKGRVEALRASASQAWTEKEGAEKINDQSADRLVELERVQEVSHLVERLQELRREVMKTGDLRSVAHQTELRGFHQAVEEDEGVKKMLNERNWMRRYISALGIDLFRIGREACAGRLKPLDAWANVEARIYRLKKDVRGTTHLS